MRVLEKFVTSAAPEIVWQILSDVEHWREWTPTIIEITPEGAGGLRVGARYRVVQPKLRPAVYEVTECVPNERFTWVQKLPGGGLVADHQIMIRNGATEVELSFSSEGGLGSVIAGIFAKKIGSYVATEAKSLKERCETLARASAP